ncbi:MAG: hypothetical protein ACJA2W_001447 [Planctomycetota bacterium]|jgi:hypothetical protein
MVNVFPRLAIPALALMCGLGLWLLVSDPVEPPSAAGVESEDDTRDSDARATDSLAPIAAGAARAVDPDGRSSLLARPGMWATVEIRVADRNGPVEGAIVRPHGKFLARPMGSTGGEEDGRDLVTGLDGRLSLEIAPWTQSTITITRPGLEWGQERTWRSPAAGKHATLKIRLLLGTENGELQVLSSPGGAAIRGARVTVASASTLTVPLNADQTTTDENGVAYIPTTPEGASDRYRVSVSAENHAKGSHTQEEPDADGRQTIWLKRNAVLRGSVAVPTSGGSENGRQPPWLDLIPADWIQGNERRGSEPVPMNAWLKVKDPTSDGPSNPASKRHTTNAELDGTWSFDGIQFAEGLEELKNLVLIVRQGSVIRVLARGIRLRPGDVVVIDDPWIGRPALDLEFVLESGRPAADLGGIVLVREEPASPDGKAETDSPARTSGVVGPEGNLRFSSLPKGRWRWEARGHAPLADVGGVIEHDGQPGTKTIRLTGYSSLRGRIVDTSGDDKPTAANQDPAFPGQGRPRRKVLWRIVGEQGTFGSTLADAEWSFFLPLVPVDRSIEITHADALNGSILFEGKQTITVALGTEERTDVVLKHAKAPSFDMTKDPWLRSR